MGVVASVLEKEDPAADENDRLDVDDCEGQKNGK